MVVSTGNMIARRVVCAVRAYARPAPAGELPWRRDAALP